MLGGYTKISEALFLLEQWGATEKHEAGPQMAPFILYVEHPSELQPGKSEGRVLLLQPYRGCADFCHSELFITNGNKTCCDGYLVRTKDTL